VQFEAIARAPRHTAWRQGEADGVDQRLGQVLGAWAELLGWEELGLGSTAAQWPPVVNLTGKRLFRVCKFFKLTMVVLDL
jgi:hypothetical protein